MKRRSSHDLLLSIYQRKSTNRTPIASYARYLPRGAADRELRSAGVALIDYYPVVSMLAPPWHMLPGYLSEVKNCDLDIRFTWENGERLEVRTYKTPVGSISEHIQRDPGYGSEWIKKHYVEREEDYKILQYIVENVVFTGNFHAFEQRRRDLGEDGVVLARLDRSPYQKLLIELAGPDRFLIDLAEERPPLLELLSVMEHRLEDAFNLALESSAEAFWQPDNITADMTPPKYFGQYCKPLYDRRGAVLKSMGKPYVIHMDGRIKPLADLIASCCFDCVESFSLPEVGGDLPLQDAFARWPDKSVAANFPAPMGLREDAEIRAFSESVIAEVQANGRPFILQISEDVPEGSWRRILPILLDVTGAAD